MKKLMIAALLTVTVVTSAFAKDKTKLNRKVLQTFEYQYADAENVQWSEKADYVKAVFELDGEKTEAYYNTDGIYIGTSKNITLADLPTAAKRTFAKKYADYTVNEAIRFDAPEETAYFLSAENEKETLVLKVTGAGISIFKKTSK